jgi:prophage regulatory protein
MTLRAARQPALCVPEEVASSAVGDLIPGWAGVCQEVHKSRVQLWRDVRAGVFPAPIEMGPNRVAWIRSEVEQWKRTRPRRTYRSPVSETISVGTMTAALHGLAHSGKAAPTVQLIEPMISPQVSHKTGRRIMRSQRSTTELTLFPALEDAALLRTEKQPPRSGEP